MMVIFKSLTVLHTYSNADHYQNSTVTVAINTNPERRTPIIWTLKTQH